MKFGIRTPSLKKRVAARTSWKRFARHSLGLKAPRGMGFLTNPKKAVYNRVYNRTSISVDKVLKTPKTRNSKSNKDQNNSIKDKGIQSNGLGNVIRSSSKALTVTSKNFEKLRNQITDIYNLRTKLKNELRKAQIIYYFLSLINFFSYSLIIGFFYKKISHHRSSQKLLIEELKEKISDAYVKLTFADKSQFEKSWLNCIDSFDELMLSEKIWDLTYSEDVDSIKARTVAQHAIKRTTIPKERNKDLEFIRSDLKPLFLANNNGPDLYFYPTFLILYKNREKFGIFDLRETFTEMKLTGYVEEESVPSDSEVIQHTWKKTNKDGSPDKRFKDNYQIPVVKYGNLTITSDSGLEESYMFSNADLFEDFAKTYESHGKRLVKK